MHFVFTPRPDHAFEPFPMTGIQPAYWVGMITPATDGGGEPLRLKEFEVVDLDVRRLQRASDAWTAQHEALRTVVTMGVKL